MLGSSLDCDFSSCVAAFIDSVEFVNQENVSAEQCCWHQHCHSELLSLIAHVLNIDQFDNSRFNMLLVLPNFSSVLINLAEAAVNCALNAKSSFLLLSVHASFWEPASCLCSKVISLCGPC